MQSCNYNMDDFTLDVYSFNDLAGNIDKLSKNDFIAQMKCLKEEVSELDEEIINWNDPVNLTKETIDVLYVAIGILKKLENMGIDVSYALREVAENNLMKFPSEYQVATFTQERLKETGVDSVIEQNADTGLFIIRNSAGKVMKPFNYVKADISAAIPVGLKLEGGNNE